MTIGKKELRRMYKEHNQEYMSLFKGSVSLLHLMLSYKIYAMLTCNRQQKEYYLENDEGEPIFHVENKFNNFTDNDDHSYFNENDEP